jgi:acetyl esterase
MPLDPTLKMILDSSGREAPPLSAGSVADARAGYEMLASAGGPLPELASVLDRTFPGPAGDIPIRIYTPKGDGPFPVVLFLHGGGFTIGSIASHDPVAQQIAAQAEAIVVSVDYRLAPEHPFPAAVDDSYAALEWVAANAASFGGDPTRLGITGDSAGGTLSAVTAIQTRDRGGPALRLQALIYPAVDGTMGFPSIEENGEGMFLTKDSMAWFWKNYSDDGRIDPTQPLASPINTPDLSNVAPALIITAEFDPLRDEGEAYAKKLEEAGVPVTLSRYDGMTHVFIQLAGMVEGGRRGITEVATAFQKAFAG